MKKSVREIRTDPVLILQCNAFIKPDEMQRLQDAINDQLKSGAMSIVLSDMVSFQRWEYGRVETITQFTDE